MVGGRSGDWRRNGSIEDVIVGILEVKMLDETQLEQPLKQPYVASWLFRACIREAG